MSYFLQYGWNTKFTEKALKSNKLMKRFIKNSFKKLDFLFLSNCIQYKGKEIGRFYIFKLFLNKHLYAYIYCNAEKISK